MTTFFVTSAVGQSMSGFLVDKVGARTSMYTGLVLLIASAVALGMAENVPMLYLPKSRLKVTSEFYGLTFS